MAQQINDNFQNYSPKALDNKYLKIGQLVYASTAEANSVILLPYRSRGLTVLINDDVIPHEYWYRDGIADIDLIPKCNCEPDVDIETDPVAIAKSITLLAGTNVSIPETATQILGSNPSWTINASIETDPVAIAKTITLIAGSNITISETATQILGSNPSWTINASGNRVEPLQETCDVGHTTTTSIIIGSSLIAHSGVAGQLVVGSASTASSAATNGVALNNSTVTGVNATAANSANASGSGSFAGGSSTASGPNSAAFGVTGNASGSGATKLGSGCTASGDNSVATGASTTASGVASFTSGTANTASGVNSASFGTLNTNSGKHCMAVGTQNIVSASSDSAGGNELAVGQSNTVSKANSAAIGRSNTVQGGDSCISLGIANTQNGYEFQAGMPAGAMQGAGAVALGGVNITSGDFSIAIGYNNTANSKAGVALGWHGKTVTPGEIVISQGGISKDTGGAYVGQSQTSLIHFRRWDNASDPASSTTRFLYSVGDENIQSDGTPANGFDTVWGKTWYPIEALNVYYITGKLTGITATGDICVWTIETYLKNVAGTVTGGTTSFTNVLRDAAFVTMDTVILDTTITDSGNTKKLYIKYHNTGVSYPNAKYSCLMTITKLGW